MVATIVAYLDSDDLRRVVMVDKKFRNAIFSRIACKSCKTHVNVGYHTLDGFWVCFKCDYFKYLQCHYCCEVAVTDDATMDSYFCRNGHVSSRCFGCFKAGRIGVKDCADPIKHSVYDTYGYNSIQSQHEFQYISVHDPRKIPNNCWVKWKCHSCELEFHTHA